MLVRREFLEKVATGAVAAAALSVARPSAASTGSAAPGGTSPTSTPEAAAAPMAPAQVAAVDAAPPPWELLSPLAAGASVAPGWQLVDLSAVRDGACVVTIQNDRGHARRIHVCRNDGSPQGLAHTGQLDLVVMNEGHGELPTEETLAQAVAGVARTMAANEARLSGHVLGELLAHRDRVLRFASVDGPAAAGKLR